jgi:hypothetical protein
MAQANQAGIPAALLALMGGAAAIPPPALAAVAQCLHTVSEDNMAVARAIAADASLGAHLAGLASRAADNSGSVLMLRAAVAGVVANARVVAPEQALPLVLSTATAVLAIDVPAILAPLALHLGAAYAATATAATCEPRAAIEDAAAALTAQQTTLETLANLLAAAETDASGWAEAADAHDDDAAGDEDDALDDVVEGNAADDDDGADGDVGGLVALLAQHSLPALVRWWPRAKFAGAHSSYFSYYRLRPKSVGFRRPWHKCTASIPLRLLSCSAPGTCKSALWDSSPIILGCVPFPLPF